jgi:transcriptional regulator with XRE-family HTH domain
MEGGPMNLKELAKSRGTNLSRIADQTGIPKSTLYAISQGETAFENVGISTFIKLGEALGMSVEEVFESPNITPEELASYHARKNEIGEEGELLDIYRSLDDRGRRVLMSTARALAE